MNIYAAEKAMKWLLNAGIAFRIESDGSSFEVSLARKQDASALCWYLRHNQHVAEVFDGMIYRIY